MVNYDDVDDDGEVFASTEWCDYNVTTEVYPTKDPALKTAYDVLVQVILAVIMLSMGCGITFKDLRDHLRKPVGPAIGQSPPATLHNTIRDYFHNLGQVYYLIPSTVGACVPT